MIQFLILTISIIIIFTVLTLGLKFIRNRIQNSPNRIFNIREYFPEDELHTLRQVFYLVLMFLCIIIIFYSFYTLIYKNNDVYLFAFIEIAFSIYLASKLEEKSVSNVILFFILIPFGSIDFFITGGSLVTLFDLVHMFAFIYYIKVFYFKFMEYTESNGLGIAIILLFGIIFISFFTTVFAEGVAPLDAISMVSNAFTSNGYAILGKTSVGKFNSLFLVWGGYILSGVGTATLTAAILQKHFNRRFDELEELIKKNNDD